MARPAIVTGMFWDREAAERAYQALRSRGYTDADINVMMSAATRQRFFGEEPPPGTALGSKALEGAGVGAGVGAVTGGVIAALVAAATVVVPGVGLVLAGPLAAALAGAGAGSLTGGVIGALIGAGIPEDRARVYEHLHIDDFLERAGAFQNEVIVLTHFSQRYRPEEIREALRALPEALARRVVAFLPG